MLPDYVELLVLPTVIEPLCEEWTAVLAAVVSNESNGENEGAKWDILDFHRRICNVWVLDPACCTGNFLYVTLEHLKRLEGEVLEVIRSYIWTLLFDKAGGMTVTPEQMI